MVTSLSLSVFFDSKCNVTPLVLDDTVLVIVYVSPEIERVFVATSKFDVIPVSVAIVKDASFLLPEASVIVSLMTVELFVVFPSKVTLLIALLVSSLI